MDAVYRTESLRCPSEGAHAVGLPSTIVSSGPTDTPDPARVSVLCDRQEDRSASCGEVAQSRSAVGSSFRPVGIASPPCLRCSTCFLTAGLLAGVESGQFLAALGIGGQALRESAEDGAER